MTKRVKRTYTHSHTILLAVLFGSSSFSLKTHHIRNIYIISKQVYRSGTSIGANVSEAHNAQSKADFVTKMTIASKEANETTYWLNLLHDNGYLDDRQFSSLNNDTQRILCKLVAIVKTTRQNMEKRKN